MSLPIERVRIKGAITKNADPAVDLVAPGGTPNTYRAADTQFEIGLFQDETTLMDLTNVTHFVFVVLDVNTRRQAPYVKKEVAIGSFTSATLTAEQWADGSEDHCHVKLKLTKEDTNLDFTGESSNQKSFAIVGYVKINDGGTTRYAVAFRGTWILEEVGLGDELPARESGENLWTNADGSFSIKHRMNGKVYKFWLDGPETAPGLVYEAGVTP